MGTTLWYIHIICCTSLIAGTLGEKDNSDGDVEPPFPSLQGDYNFLTQVHIVSEYIKGGFSRSTIDEYIDAEGGHEFITTTNQHGKVSTLIDGANDLIYRFQPYTCTRSTSADMVNLGFVGNWVYNYHFEHHNTIKTFPVFGVAALWINGAYANKTFSKANRIYSAFNDRLIRTNRWTMRDDVIQKDIHLYFRAAAKAQAASKMPLELIQFEDISTKEIVETINVISVSYLLDRHDQSKFVLPLGYGCPTPDQSEHIGQRYSLLDDNYKLDMEVTATKMMDSEDENGRQVDTLSVRVAKAFFYDDTPLGDGDKRIESKFREQLTLLSFRAYSEPFGANKKYITDIQTGVKYTIDGQSGQCEIARWTNEQINAKAIRFANNLTLDMNQYTLKEILEDINNFNYIRTEQHFADSKLVYWMVFEKSDSKIVVNPSSIIRVYSRRSGTDEPRLEQVIIQIYNKARTQIESVYTFHVLEFVRLKQKYEMAELFDVSQCYMDRKSHTWVSLKYPVSPKVGQILADNLMDLRTNFYERFGFKRQFDFFRVPKIEINIDNYYMHIRILILDAPSKLYQYELKRNKDFALGANDRVEMAANDQQCADYCKLYSCKTFVYCDNHVCKLSGRQQGDYNANDNVIATLTNSDSCTMYAESRQELGYNGNRELTSLDELVSILQHDNYDVHVLPPTPEELLGDPESQIGSEERKEAVREYSARLIDYMEQYDIPLMTLIVLLDESKLLVALTPIELVVEHDPIAGLITTDSDDNDNLFAHQHLPKFYHVLAQRRLRVDNGATHVVNGQSYEQCSLLCIDRGCYTMSYCQHEALCVVSDIADTQTITSQSVEDSGCVIAQRDFLTKFSRFENTGRPMDYQLQRDALSPSDCAHMCILEKGFKCMAFDYCSSSGTGNSVPRLRGTTTVQSGGSKNSLQDGASSASLKPSACFLQAARDWTALEANLGDRLKANRGQQKQQQQQRPRKTPKKETGCDHYSRSILADFDRLDNRRFKQQLLPVGETLDQAHYEVHFGLDVDQCARQCIEDHNDCSLFEFCFFAKSPPDTADSGINSSRQACTHIIGNLSSIVQGDGGKSRTTRDLFEASTECFVYSLRKDAVSGRFRYVADLIESKRPEKENRDESRAGHSVGAIVWTVLIGFTISLTIGVAIVLVPKYREPIQRRIDRVIEMRRANF